MAFETLRTPDERFENLQGYDFEPNYIEIIGLRIHYVDEGSKDAPIILLMHGEPSWSYLYRKMIPPLVKAGYRVIAPDLLGFGKSDKLKRREDYSYQLLVDIYVEFLVELGLNAITMFCQDWGGLLGLRLLGEEPDRFSRVIAANTALPSAKGLKGLVGYFLFKREIKKTGIVSQEKLSEETNFVNWVAYTQTIPSFDVADIIQGATLTKLTSKEIAAYDAPFPDESYKEGPRILPMLVPSQLRENQNVWDNVLRNWDKPFLVAFSDKDPITRGGHKKFLKYIPNAENDPTKGAAHFLQEDQPELLVKKILKFINSNP